ncbi:DUF87 domain-containing protein [Apilactobacillus apisilvae]|uniref:DNA translocase FtsK n=1 Tax=Apilactobacillus apisilvae TaxID=2923364 RepID=A0ABY4PID4_9LACO|nr:DNA translocase FtsK [Apilactobacillus apisilvae]UQS85260.1 DUF87 domain-containing protein [Apilactobacillus apisilvae]
MEHYDGPAFYRKYRINTKKQENRHINKIKENKKHNYNRKKDLKQSDVDTSDNPIAQRAAEFKPTKQQEFLGSSEPYYKLKISLPYLKIKQSLEVNSDNLIVYADNDEGAIDLDNYDPSESIVKESANEDDDNSTETLSDENPTFDNDNNEDVIEPIKEKIQNDDNTIIANQENDINENNDSNDSLISINDDDKEQIDNEDDDSEIEPETEDNKTPYSKYVDLYANDFEYLKNIESDGKKFVAAKPDDVNNLKDSEVIDKNNKENPSDESKSTNEVSNSKDAEVNDNKEEHSVLGHSLSSIINEEQDAQKDLSLFNDKKDESEETVYDDSKYQFPSLDLLSEPKNVDDDSLDDWIESQAQKLDETLSAFHVNANVVDWTNGPTVTQFQVKLQLGVKVSKITNLTDDLKMALAAKDIRIEAPIPGKTTVGIEIPNPHPRPVMLSEVLDTPQFKNNKDPLTVALGVDLTGKPQMTDIRKMPHGLIAGATGSGKSVFLNSLLISLLYKATPAELKMILIDPKAVEMAPYDNLPHLLSPVISDPKQASAALKWAVKEMDERYEKLASSGARNVEQFNKMAEEHGEYGLKIPYILIVIDELADLMMVASSEVQDYIVRITQKARAAGIHLIVATQRPSVDIITGTIKNNIPTRVAFMVSSQVDSRTIIDNAGAERLLGKGDMLYLGSGASQSIRLQGTFVTDEEIENITSQVRKQGQPKYAFQPESLLKHVNKVEQQDELMPQVLKYISKEDNVSTSKLQRVFSIGYNRAASLIDNLEQNNYVSGQHGSKPRDVYLTEKDYKKLNI